MRNNKVFGVAIMDLSGMSKINGIELKWYSKWKGMLTRCYSTKTQLLQPTYKGCTVCKEWLLASNFKKWFDQQEISTGYHLDKDILKHGNKEYSPETCRFIPRSINNLFNDHALNRGKYPSGVSYHKPTCKFQVSMSTKYIGLFDTVEEASYVYKKEKLIHCINVADELLLSGEINKEIADAVKNKANLLYNDILTGIKLI